MATTLLELTQQGDPGTLASEDQAEGIKLLTPHELYELWERESWVSQEFDFSRDRADWAGLTAEQRKWTVWLLATFFASVERLTAQFSSLVMAHEDPDEEAYLATQKVDWARTMQFFDRFHREVIGLEQPDIEGRLSRVRQDLNDAAFVELFDEALAETARRLSANPRDRGAKVDFVTSYHIVTGGSLALTVLHFVRKAWKQNDLLPGLGEGFEKIARDEHRHVAYGTWYLKQACSRDPALADRMRAKLQELLPLASAVLVPPGQDPRGEWEIVGYTSAEIYEFAFATLTRRLKAIGVPLVREREPVAT